MFTNKALHLPKEFKESYLGPGLSQGLFSLILYSLLVILLKCSLAPLPFLVLAMVAWAIPNL